jgi:hypothetical protein
MIFEGMGSFRNTIEGVWFTVLVEILIARSLILLSKRATRPYIYGTSTGGGSAAPRVAKPDGVVDGIFP